MHQVDDGGRVDLRTCSREGLHRSLHREIEILDYLPLVGSVAMELETEVRQSGFSKTPVHDLKGGSLLAHE